MPDSVKGLYRQAARQSTFSCFQTLPQLYYNYLMTPGIAVGSKAYYLVIIMYGVPDSREFRTERLVHFMDPSVSLVFN